jgi:AcrR family transcriptional regulator
MKEKNCDKKADTILDTTIQLFLRDGARKITMDDIAENSNVSKVTIYKYFADKDTLYREIGVRIFSEYIFRLIQLVSSGDALVSKLYRFLDVICDFTDSGRLALCGELAKYNSDVGGDYERYLQTYKRSLTALIDEGMREGLLKSGWNGTWCSITSIWALHITSRTPITATECCRKGVSSGNLCSFI